MKHDFGDLRKSLQNSSLIRTPSMNISTFGETQYIYYHLSKVSDTSTKVREGSLTVKKPLIITAELIENLVVGFDRETSDFAHDLLNRYSSQLRMIGYQFHHHFREEWLEKDSEQSTLYGIQDQTKDNPMVAILVGPQSHWEASLLKVYGKIIDKSFMINIEELEERGMFDTHGVPPKVYEEIETSFDESVTTTLKQLEQLGEMLLRYKLFEKYETRFFELMRKIKSK